MNGPDVAQIHLRSMLEPQEQWNATHAQLLKSVADAQAKLLAAQNETNDRLESASRNLGLVEQRLTERLKGLSDLSFLIGQTQETVRNSHGFLTGRLDAIGAILAELLTVRRPVARPRAKRRKR